MNKYLFLCAIILACCLPISAQLAITKAVVIAEEGKANTGLLAIDVPAPGQVAIAWRDAKGATRYTLVDLAKSEQNDGKVIDGEQVCGLTHHILGIRRDDNGVVRMGLNNGKKLIEWTRQANGKWIASDTKTVSAGYYGATARYDVNRKTGRGAFIAVNDEKCSVLLTGNEEGQWQSAVLEEEQNPVTRGALVINPAGIPVVAYQVLKGQGIIKAGTMATASAVTRQAVQYFPMAITANAAGTLYLVVAVNGTLVECYSSADDGASWKRIGQVAKKATNGDAAYLAAAAAPKGRTLAALIADSSAPSGCQLAISTDAGATWQQFSLPGAMVQCADLGFDENGDLYVAYFHSDDKVIYLLTTKL